MQSSLAPLLVAAGVPQLLVRSVSVLPNGTVRVSIGGTETAPISRDAWTVAAAGLAKEVGAPVQLTGRLFILSGTATIRYRRAAVHPAAPELARLKKFLQAKGPDVTHFFVPCDSDPPAVSAKRLDYLTRRFPGEDPGDGMEQHQPYPGVVDPDTVLVGLMQKVEAFGESPAPANASK